MTLPADPAPAYTHLVRLTDHGGLHEHARGTRPRREHAYCVDDVARGLVVLAREGDLPPEAAALPEQYLEFVLLAQAPDGRSHNRRGTDLCFRDQPSVDDCWGRALWGLGAVARSGDHRALAAFERSAHLRSPHVRATAFAALGAAEVLEVLPDHPAALGLLTEAALQIGRPAGDPVWPWPEPRLTYANAALPEALLAAGSALALPRLVDDGLRLLGWLLDLQTRDGHLSVVPVAGRGPAGRAVPGFDQQPIEVAALADACVRAHRLTGDGRWLDGLDLAVGWFLGSNDIGTPMHDGAGGGYDGLMSGGRNDNRGAESTLALLSTLQHARARSLSLR